MDHAYYDASHRELNAITKLLTKRTCCAECRQIMEIGEAFTWTEAQKAGRAVGSYSTVWRPRHVHDCLREKAISERAAAIAQAPLERAKRVEKICAALAFLVEQGTMSAEDMAKMRVSIEQTEAEKDAKRLGLS